MTSRKESNDCVGLARFATPPPERLSELRLAALAGQAHLQSLRRACRVVDVRAEDWSGGPNRDLPHLLLIESSGLRKQPRGVGPLADEMVERALELLDWCGREGVPAALWETFLRRRINTPLSLMEGAPKLFVADPEAVEPLAQQLGGRRPMQLPLAAQVIPEERIPFAERKIEVAFLGRWAEWFSGHRREELEAILDAAAQRGLVIFGHEEDREDYLLPERFLPFAVTVPSDRRGIESFRDARIVVGLDPRNHGRLMVPQVVFDALAAGSAVISPNHTGLRRLVGHITVLLRSREEAEREMDRLLGDEGEWGWMSERARNAILNAHTYKHRVATIASAFGLRLVP